MKGLNAPKAADLNGIAAPYLETKASGVAEQSLSYIMFSSTHKAIMGQQPHHVHKGGSNIYG
jgi:hypothetical protein